jgi:hypothetical protein
MGRHTRTLASAESAAISFSRSTLPIVVRLRFAGRRRGTGPITSFTEERPQSSSQPPSHRMVIGGGTTTAELLERCSYLVGQGLTAGPNAAFGSCAILDFL